MRDRRNHARQRRHLVLTRGQAEVAKAVDESGRAGLPGRLGVTAKLVLVAASVGFAAIAGSLAYQVSTARGGLETFALESWTLQAGQIARSAAGGVAAKDAAAIAEAYAEYAKAGSAGLLRVIAFDGSGIEIDTYAAPGYSDIIADSTMRTLIRATPLDTAVQPLEGRIVMVAPARAAGSASPVGYVGLVWDSGRIDAAQSSLVGPLVVQGGALLALLAALAWATRRLVARPLQAIGERAQTLADGGLESPVAHCSRGDEVGALARALERLRAAAVERVAAERQAEAERAAAESRREEAVSRRAATAKLQGALVRLVAAALARLAEGDLTSRIRVEVPREYQRLKDDFNLAMDRLQDALRGVVATGGQIDAGTAEIERAAGELARRTEQQAVGVQQTVAAVGEITQSVSRTAEGAAAAREAVASVAADAGQSQAIVGEAIAAMNGIEKSSGEVSKIIGVIDEIAFQTNLLALNAGVEAARAGDAGRGFVVVAQEVRTLAQRSAEAAKEIKDLINASAAQVKNGSKLVLQTGETIQRINGSVAGISTIVAGIAKSAGEQADGLKGVNTAMGGIDQATQRNAAMAAQFAAASRALAGEARELDALVAQFRIEAEPVYRRQAVNDVRPPVRADARQVAYAEPRPRTRAEARPAPQSDNPRPSRMPRAALNGNVLALDDGADTDAWQEF